VDKYAIGINRLWEHIHTEDFGIVSAFVSPDKLVIPKSIRHDKRLVLQYVLEQNNKRHEALKKKVKYNYIELDSVWFDTKGNRYNEKSLFITHTSYDEIYTLAKDYEQETFIYAEVINGAPAIYEEDTDTQQVIRRFSFTQVGFRQAWTAYSQHKSHAFTFVEKASHTWFTRLPFTASMLRMGKRYIGNYLMMNSGTKYEFPQKEVRPQ